MFGGSIASGKSRWTYVDVDPNKRHFGLGSPDAFTEDDINNLGNPQTTKDDHKSFDDSLDKFVKMLDNYPELKKMYEEGEDIIQAENRKKESDFGLGRWRTLNRGTTVLNSINLSNAENITKPLKHKNTESKRRNITESTIYKFFSTSLSPAVAMDATLPFNGGVMIEIGTKVAQFLTENHEHTGISRGKVVDAERDKRWKRRKVLQEKEEKGTLTREEKIELLESNPFGIKIDVAGKPSKQRRRSRSLTPVRYTHFPTMMLGNNPDKNMRNIEKVDTDYRAGFASEQEVRLDLGLPTDNLFEGFVVNLQDGNFVQNLLSDLGMEKIYEKYVSPNQDADDIKEFLLDTMIPITDVPPYNSEYFKDDPYYKDKKISILDAIDRTYRSKLRLHDRERTEGYKEKEKRFEIRIRYNFIKHTGAFSMLVNDEDGNPDIHYKTLYDMTKNRKNSGKYY